jgi:Putative Actinobacterial Holin-X, holin superfamily III
VSSTVGGPSTDTDGRRSIGELLSDVSQDVTLLLRQEVALAKAEVKQTASSAGKGVGLFAGAGVSGHFVLMFLSIAGWWGLGDGIGRAWAALIVALVWLIIGAVLGLMGKKELKTVGGVPQTTDTLKKIPNAAKGNEEQS